MRAISVKVSFVVVVVVAAACAGESAEEVADPGAKEDAYGTGNLVELAIDSDLRCETRLRRAEEFGLEPGFRFAFGRVDLVRAQDADLFDMQVQVVIPGGTSFDVSDDTMTPEEVIDEGSAEPASGSIQGDVVSIDGESLSASAGSIEVRGAYLGAGELRLPGASAQVELACWQPKIEPRFRYDGAGACVDALGDSGRSPLPSHFVRGSGFGQCAVLEGDFGEDALSYNAMGGIDLRGADLSGAELFFAHLVAARLEGARMAGFEFGYAKVTGSLDEFTELPDLACPQPGPDYFRCLR